jgi:hypothetical protein
MNRASLELELVTAAQPFLRPGHLITAARRQKLREAVLHVIRENGGAAPPDLIATPSEALISLRALLRRCEEIGVPWPDIVVLVNRGIGEDAPQYQRRDEP